jgi:hypothetical protein
VRDPRLQIAFDQALINLRVMSHAVRTGHCRTNDNIREVILAATGTSRPA